MHRFWIGVSCFVGGVLSVCLAISLYLRFGVPPVAVTDPAFPMEKQIVQIPLNARIKREMPGSSPVKTTPANLIAGAQIYGQHCAFCHGTMAGAAPIAQHMYPPVPQLWAKHHNGVVGVSDDPVGETFWKVKNGIRLSGMPAYADLLSEEQMWMVSVLLKSADQPLPSAVTTQLQH
jgi:thiosulfate dehydrogenase